MSLHDIAQLSFGVACYALLCYISFRDEIRYRTVIPFSWKQGRENFSENFSILFVVLGPTFVVSEFLKWLSDGSLVGKPVGMFADIVRWIAEALIFKPVIQLLVDRLGLQ